MLGQSKETDVDRLRARRSVAKGLRSEDRPFQPSLVLRDPEAAEAAVGLDMPVTEAIHQARRALLANLVVATHEGPEWIFYSRDNDHYAGLRRYVPPFYRRRYVVDAVQTLEDTKLIEHERTKPSRSSTHRSRVRASTRLRSILASLDAGATTFAHRELVVLRGTNGWPMPYAETQLTRDLRNDLVEVNLALQRLAVEVRHPAARYDAAGYVLVDGRRINPTRKSYERIFNGCFLRGGRFYGPWWQSLPAWLRTAIYIDGMPAVERDFSCCHPRLLAATVGLQLGSEDFYSSFGTARHEAKVAVNIMLNAPTAKKAFGALTSELRQVHGEAAPRQSCAIMKTIAARYPALSRLWNSGYGLRLQNHDAHICMRVQQRMRGQGIPCLSIHDSFVVPANYAGSLEEVMEAEFQWMCMRLRAA
jgi:hypothetical protein